ncbi:hypothetical protein LEN26_015010 [Aphanomyces euteiches]|nr:hypothetical protein LEN26_015010 [Aphanomyces euteiches]KAH9114808.1 hypothetical protein AeMF1_011121 [Aphanomyces euteiches]KAH9191506.1 hypothetical protein AeNC1_006519 [Aphanomyces euteiches]
MEQFYAGKGLFVTGGTGFIGKTLIEKLLRSTPDIGKIYVMVRPKKGRSAHDRLESDIISSAIFNRLRSERPDFDTFIRSKLVAVGGDINSASLGFSDADAQLLVDNVNIVVHSAASVSFNEPLDVAVEMNTLGAMYMINFAKQIKSLIAYVHVSTAYVNSNRRNCTLLEQLYPLDFDVEAAIDAANSTEDIEKLHLNLIGTYPNTYTLTKSMAEHMLTKYQDHVPLVLLRPTIVGASWKEPVPGWVDQLAAAGAIFMAGGMGILTILPGDPRSVADIVPVDFCVNTILLSAFAKAQESMGSPPMIVHSGTSDPREHPLRWRVPIGTVSTYFQQNPPEKGISKPSFTMFTSHQLFQIHWFLRYTLPSSAYSTIANATGNQHHMKQASRLWKLTWRARQLVELFKPFTENQWVFSADGLQKLRSMPEYNSAIWCCDANEIMWERYLLNYCVGLKKWILSEDVIDVDIEGVQHTEMALNTERMLAWDPDHHAISFPGLLPDLSWAFTSSRKPGYTKSGIWGRFMGATGWKEGVNHEATYVPRLPRDSLSTIREQVIGSKAVQDAINAQLKATKLDRTALEQQVNEIFTKMASTIDYKTVRMAGWLLRKVWRQMYEKIIVDEAGLEEIRNLVKARQGPIVLIPTHRSYIDFLMMTYLFFAYNIPIPHIFAGEDFLNMGRLTQVLREGGAFFVRRSFKDDPLYTAVFSEYTQYLLSKGHTIEFFLEGTRSRSGKQLPPQFGMLSTVVKCFEAGRVDNIHIVPVTIDYDKPVELSVHQKELLGEGKVKESVGALLRSYRVLRQDFGSVSVRCGAPIHLRQFIQQHNVSPPLDAKTNQPVPLLTDLAYTITETMVRRATCTPCHLVATILLMYRNGITKDQLVAQTEWLRSEIVARGGRVLSSQGRTPAAMTERALSLLGDFIIWRRSNLIEPAITNRDQYSNMIGLGHYRNKILHWFYKEGVLACTYHALCLANQSSEQTAIGYSKVRLIQSSLFLHDMLAVEFVRKEYLNSLAELEESLTFMKQRNVLTEDSATSNLVLTDGSQPTLSLLCAVLWPFIDSYWVAVTSLFALKSGEGVPLKDLVKRMQWLAEMMYHDRVIAHYESCSMETLNNALTILTAWGVITLVDDKQAMKKTTVQQVYLTEPYRTTKALDELASKIAAFRKLPLAGPKSMDLAELVTQFPTLSKL